MPECVVANFNCHLSVDGWGRPFDLTEVVAALDADAVVLQESFRPEDGPSTAEVVADALGYQLIEQSQGAGRRLGLHPFPDETWGSNGIFMKSDPVVLMDGTKRMGRLLPDRDEGRSRERGELCVAILTRRPIISTRLLDLGTTRSDPCHRVAIDTTINVDGTNFEVVGIHQSHLTRGSLIHFTRLRRLLAGVTGPAALLGDMNLWGPMLVPQLPGWRRAVRGRSWPSWRPHSQLDHCLVTRPVEVLSGEVLRLGNSDHFPIRAHLRF